MFQRFAQAVVNRRRHLPPWIQSVLTSVTRHPASPVSQLAAYIVRGAPARPTAVPPNPIRVFITPTNYAGQGFRWARCLEAFSREIGAKNLAIRIPGGFAFEADTTVSLWQATYSRGWAEAEWAQCVQFSHVLIEAERPTFAAKFKRNLGAEVAALRTAGISIAFLSHGTDVRDPNRHRTQSPLSPYHLDPRTTFLAEQASANRNFLSNVSEPVFVSTPDLLLDVPYAHWCPVVIDPERFRTDTPPLMRPVPRVVHISSDSVQKGSDLVVSAMAPLVAEGVIEFELIDGVPSAEIPSILAGADIVLDQFRLESYGVAACEALAAGRVVIGNVSQQVRDHIRVTTSKDLPIIQATPEELGVVIHKILANPSEYRTNAQLGSEFVREVHSGGMSAHVLSNHWIRPAR